MTKTLTIGKSGFSLPLDAVTITIGVLGIRGSGKTHTASVMAEEMLNVGLQVIVLDPLDVWYGLRTSRDGKGPGFSITVLGGEHEDIPLEASSGSIVADFAVEHGASMILSLRHFSKTHQRQFVADFCERLYRLKGKSGNRAPVHVIIDEADEVAPQRLGKGSERCFGAVDTLVRRGRSSGIGVTMISQRAAAINKDILTQIELLAAHRVIGPNDRKAIESWIEIHPVGDQASKMAASLATLKTGECWIWSPSWLNVFERVKIRQRTTFDSGATPKIGEAKIEPSGRADIDLNALRERMASTIERAEDNDPKKLKRRIGELELELKRAGTGDHTDCQAAQQALEIRNANLIAHISEIQKSLDGARELIYRVGHQCSEYADGLKVPELSEPTVVKAGDRVMSPFGPGIVIPFEENRKAEMRPLVIPSRMRTGRTAAGGRKPSPPETTSAPRRRDADTAESNGDLSGPQRKLINVLATHGGRLSKKALALMAGYSVKGGGFANPLGNLRTRGYVEYQSGEVVLTQAGTHAAESDDEVSTRTGYDLIQWWLDNGGLSGPEKKIIEALLRIGTPVDKDSLATEAGYEAKGGGFNNPLGRLRTRGLINRGQPVWFAEEVGL